MGRPAKGLIMTDISSRNVEYFSSVGEAAKRMGVSKNSIYGAINSGFALYGQYCFDYVCDRGRSEARMPLEERVAQMARELEKLRESHEKLERQVLALLEMAT